jgi:putative ABC transport system substrate-binding protein
MRRRNFLFALGGTAVGLPDVACAQQGDRARRVSVLFGAGVEGPESVQSNLATLRQALGQLGWVEGRNLQLDYRRGSGSIDSIRQHAAEIAGQGPNVILLSGTATVAPMLQVTRTIPLVFVNVADPVGAGFVESLAQPGGNITGFMQFEYSLSGKWLELLKEIAPQMKRVAVLRDPALTSGIGQFAVIQSVAPAAGIEVRPINVRDPGEIERTIAAFARSPDGGLIVTASALAAFHRDLIVALAARYKLPAVYYRRAHVDAGGLLSYGPDLIDQLRRSASYIDRILKGEKPGDLPVQAPNRYELIINLKAAKSLGLAAPPSLIARADEVIE